jgi:hypothetical protein
MLDKKLGKKRDTESNKFFALDPKKEFDEELIEEKLCYTSKKHDEF